MGNWRKKLKTDQGTSAASTDSPASPDPDDRFVDELPLSNLSNDSVDINAADEHGYHHKSLLDELDQIYNRYNHELLLCKNRIEQLIVENEKLKNENLLRAAQNDKDRIIIDRHERTIADLESQLNYFNAADLNEDCLNMIFSYLSLNEMMQVKDVCRKWQQASEHWFQKVQTLSLRVNNEGNHVWELQKNYFKHQVGSGTRLELPFLLFLRSYGHYIKYYKLNFDKKRHPNDKIEKFSYKMIPHLCRNIVDVEIQRRSQHRPTDFHIMAITWKKLEQLHIGHLSRFVGDNIHELLNNNLQLKTVKLQFEPDPVFDMSLEFLNYLPKTIEKLEINFMLKISRIQFDHFISASKTFTSLRSLKFSVLDYLSSDAAAAIANIKSLEHLYLDRVYYYESRKTIDLIANLKDLKSIYFLDNNELLEDSFINIVESCTQLEVIDIFNWKLLTDEGMAAIAKLKKLKTLRIYGKNVSAQSIVNLPESLEIFVCGTSNILDIDAIKFVKKITNLRFVDFRSCNNITNDVLEATKEIAKERKNYIHCMTVSQLLAGFDLTNLPHNETVELDIRETIPLEVFPDDIKNHLKVFYHF